MSDKEKKEARKKYVVVGVKGGRSNSRLVEDKLNEMAGKGYWLKDIRPDIGVPDDVYLVMEAK